MPRSVTEARQREGGETRRLGFAKNTRAGKQSDGMVFHKVKQGEPVL